MNKIKVSKKIGLALNEIKKYEINDVLLMHKRRFNERGILIDKWTSDLYKPLNELSLEALAEILINGYEVGETPEEKLLRLYTDVDGSEFDTGYRLGIIHTLRALKIKIKGIND